MVMVVALRQCVGVMVLTAVAVCAPACIAQPATANAQTTQPSVAGGRTEAAIFADFKQTVGHLHDTMGDIEQLADPDFRAKIGPDAVPLLKRLVDDLDELMRVQPMSRDDAAGAQLDYLSYLSLFGDSSGTARLKQIADSKDPAASVRGQAAQLFVRWMLTAKDPAAQAKVADDAEQLAKAHPDNEDLTGQLISMSHRGDANLANGDRMEAIVTTVMKNPVAETIARELADMKKLQVLEGQPLEVKGKLVDGGDFSTSQWKGKVVVVDFWATWCGPCVAGLPHLTRLYAKDHNAGLEVVGVSNDYSADSLKRFLAENKGVAWPQLFDPMAAEQEDFNPIATGLGVHILPTMFIIDKKGIVRSTNGRRTLDELLPKLLAE